MPLSVKKKKVLFFIPPYVGGAEKVTITIYKLLKDYDIEKKFVIVGKNRGDIENLIPEKENIIFLKARNIWDFVTFKIIKIIIQERPTLLFSSLHYLSLRVILASKLFKNVKAIIRSDNYLKAYRWSSCLQMKMLYPWADTLIAQQEEMYEEMMNVYKKINPNVNIVCIHNPLDIESINRLKDAENPYNKTDGTKYVWIARYHRVKGQDVLVKAFKELHERKPTAHLYLIGKIEANNEFIKEIRDFIIDNGLIECIHMIGFDKNPYKWIKHCDCFVLPSRLEGLPNSLIEAMYLGKPVVATKCIPIISRIVEDGYNGLLVDSEDYISMAKAMEEAIKLKDYKPTYEPSSMVDFIKIFD